MPPDSILVTSLVALLVSGIPALILGFAFFKGDSRWVKKEEYNIRHEDIIKQMASIKPVVDLELARIEGETQRMHKENTISMQNFIQSRETKDKDFNNMLVQYEARSQASMSQLLAQVGQIQGQLSVLMPIVQTASNNKRK